MPILRFALLWLALSVAGTASAALVSPTARPVVFASQSVQVDGTKTLSGYTSSVSMGGGGFGPATAPSSLPTGRGVLASQLAMPALTFANGTTATAVLAQARAWIGPNAPGGTAYQLAQTAGQYASQYGFSSVWFSYSQSVLVGAETTPRTLTWALFVDNHGRGSWGDPKLTTTTPSILYVSYASLTAPAGIPAAWVTNLNGNAGKVVWQLLSPTLQPTTAAQVIDVSGAFDEAVGASATHGSGYQKLVGAVNPSTGNCTAASTVCALLASTGAAFALVDYVYPVMPAYESVNDSYCPGGVGPCQRAIGTYTYTKLLISWCDCTNATLENAGNYSFLLKLTADRHIVDLSLNSQLLQDYSLTKASPSTPFDWTLVQPLLRADAAAMLKAQFPQVIKPTDGSGLIDYASLATPSSVLNTLPGFTQSGNETQDRYWGVSALSAQASPALAVQARCAEDGTTQFAAGYNVGPTRASDSAPAGGFVNLLWGTPASSTPTVPISPFVPFSTGSGSSTCVGFVRLANNNAQYYYTASPGCGPLEQAEGPGYTCPAGSVATTIYDATTSLSTGAPAVCLQGCPSGQPTASQAADGTISYACPDGVTTPQQLSALYVATLGDGAGCNANNGANDAYGWVTGPWSSWNNCGDGALRSRSVVCYDMTTGVAAPGLCGGGQPASSEEGYGGSCTAPPTYGWVINWGNFNSTCSATATRTGTLSCVDSTGVVAPTTALCTGTPPSTTDVEKVYTGCTYAWTAGPWSWTSTCSSAAAGTRSVTCTQSDGTPVADSFCSAAGTKPAATQTGNLTGCTYTWSPGAWGPWTSACSTNATRSRTVSCVQSDGTTVANSYCAAAGQAPATVDVSGNLAGCSYSWNQSGFSACTGGSGTFSYGTWTPASGCGLVTQTRTASCVATAGSATQTQTVTCQRSDGTTVANANCTGTAPASSQACTPTSGYSCGAATTSQAVTLNNGCTYAWVETPWTPAVGSACTGSLVQNRTVTCVNSIGQTVANSNCAAPTPAASQAVADYGGCSYAWTTGAFGTCAAGGTGTWAYGAWAPASGCGNAVAQTRTATCNVTANSSSQTRSIGCQRSDGASVATSYCPAASQPSASQACTPSSGYSCGVSGATAQSVILTNTCTYNWVPSGFGACHVGP